MEDWQKENVLIETRKQDTQVCSSNSNKGRVKKTACEHVGVNRLKTINSVVGNVKRI